MCAATDTCMLRCTACQQLRALLTVKPGRSAGVLLMHLWPSSISCAACGRCSTEGACARGPAAAAGAAAATVGNGQGATPGAPGGAACGGPAMAGVVVAAAAVGSQGGGTMGQARLRLPSCTPEMTWPAGGETGRATRKSGLQ